MIINIAYLYNLNDLEFKGEASRITETFRDDITIKNKGIHLGWDYRIASKWMSNLSLNHTNFDKLYAGNRILTLSDNTEDRTDFYKHNYINESAVDYSLTYQIAERKKIQLGFQYTNYDVFYRFSRLNQGNDTSLDDTILNKAYDYAVFSEYEFNKNNKWLLFF